jgi:N4-gp56 family major capsid protein
MGATQSSDWLFSPKVWQDHISAYFDRKLVWGAFALRDNELMGAPGDTVSFPYYKAIGDAEEPAEDSGLTVDKLSDDSFSASVKEVGKAVGVKDKALIKSAAAKERIFSEVQSQIARVMAEKVDKDLIAEINTVGNYEAGFVGAANTDLCTISTLNTGRVTAFGDKADQSAVLFMHSLHQLSLLNDSTSGFLKADANDPMYGVPGFAGRLLGMAVVVTDTVPQGPDLGGKKSYYSFCMKPNAYGIITKADLNPEQDRDILAREWVWSATMWYGVKAFHSKIHALDKRINRNLFATTVNA